PEILIQLPNRPKYGEIALNHPKFQDLVRRWFTTLAPILKPLVTSGEIIALQLDNETGMPQYGAGPYLTDLNPESIDQLRTWLDARYPDIAALNAAWQTDFASFATATPAPKPANSAQVSDLAAFIEDSVVAYLENLRALWQDLGIATHFYLNDVWIPAWPNHWAKKNQVAPVGYDMYPKFMRTTTTLDQPYAITFVPKVFDAMRENGPLFGPEVGCGWLDQQVQVSELATLQQMLASYLRGAQVNILYPIHDGIDPDDSKYLFHSALDTAGRENKRMAVVRALGRFVSDFGPILSQSQPLLSPVAVLHYQDGLHAPLEYAADAARMATKHLDLAIDLSITVAAGPSGLVGALAEAGYDPAVLELGKATAADLAANAVCFFPCTGRVSPEVRDKLAAYVEGGGKLVVLGTPFADPDRLFPSRIKRTWRPRSLAVFAGALVDMVLFSTLEASKIQHPLVRFTVEKLQPVMGLVKYATRAGVWISDTQTGERVWASRFVKYCQVPPSGREWLHYSGAPLAFSTPLGRGEVAYIGTLLGPHFDSPGYYLDEPEKARSVSAFFGRILKGWGIQPALEITGLEVVQRLTAKGRIVAVLNRKERRRIELALPASFAGIDRVFSYLGSTASYDGHLQAVVESGDVLVGHLLND
ncbi:MAG: beta-galactosidase, partial [Cyanobacteria bacterium REEB65]|nr:beta-galactosidase [Cyanobacteria bacterium REEB65]